jgi:hypothetical protein
MDAGRALAEMQVIADLRAEVHFALFNTIVGGVRAKLAETGFFGNELDQMSAALFTRLVDARIAERQARVVAAAYVRSEAAIHEFTEFLRHLKVVLAGPESVTPILPEQLEMYDLAVRAVVALRHDDGRNAVAHRDIRQLLFDCEGPTTVGHA